MFDHNKLSIQLTICGYGTKPAALRTPSLEGIRQKGDETEILHILCRLTAITDTTLTNHNGNEINHECDGERI